MPPLSPLHPQHILTLSCGDRPGIVGAVGSFLADNGCNIIDSAQFGDVDTGRFMMRVLFERLDAAPGGRRWGRPLQPSANASRCAGRCTTPERGRAC